MIVFRSAESIIRTGTWLSVVPFKDPTSRMSTDEKICSDLAAAEFRTTHSLFDRPFVNVVLHIDVHARSRPALRSSVPAGLDPRFIETIGIAKIGGQNEIPVCVRFIPANRSARSANQLPQTPARSASSEISESAKIIMKSFFGLPLACHQTIFPFTCEFFASSVKIEQVQVVTRALRICAACIVDPTQPIASTFSGRVIGERSFASSVPASAAPIVSFPCGHISGPSHFSLQAHSSDLRLTDEARHT